MVQARMRTHADTEILARSLPAGTPILVVGPGGRAALRDGAGRLRPDLLEGFRFTLSLRP